MRPQISSRFPRMPTVAARCLSFVSAAILIATLAACSREPVPPPPAAEAGVVQVMTEPGDAEILIDGRSHGRSPAEAGSALAIRLPSGDYTLDARKPVDEHIDLVGRLEYRHSADKPMPPVTIQLAQRLTPAGEAFMVEQQQRLNAREQEIVARFEVNEDGTATDTQTGLMWMRCSVGQEWTGQRCSGEVLRLSWNQALKAGEDMVFAGKDDWRLPTREELYTLVYCSSGRRFALDAESGSGACEGTYRKPVILDAVFPDTPLANYWSSTPNEMFSYKAWGVAFISGLIGAGSRTEYVAARLVRSARPAE